MGRDVRTKEVVDGVLDVLVVGGLLGMMIVAPNSIAAAEKIVMKYLGRTRPDKETRRVARYLRQQTIVDVKEVSAGEFQVTITEKGKKRQSLARFDSLTVAREEKWDGNWHIIMFDIPEEHKAIRDFISRHLRQIGLKPLQKSVLVYPYSLEAFVLLVKDQFPEITDNLVYVQTRSIDRHNELVGSFKTIIK